jgi:pimeloyl-ACP methyl ester carboxylesterase
MKVDGERRIAYDIMTATAPQGPTVSYVLVPGLGDLRQEYRHIAPLLYESGKSTVITLDLRGLGESDVGFQSYTPADTGRDIAMLLLQLNLKNCVLVGCSMGGASVVYAAAEASDRVSGFVMISPFLWDHPMPFGVPTLLSVLLNSLTGPSFWSSYYKSLHTLRSQPVADLDQYAKMLKRNLKQPGRMKALRDSVFSSKAECAARAPEVARLAIPVLAVYGTSDPDFPEGVDVEISELRSRLPQVAKALKVEGCGHYPHVEQPLIVANALKAFVSSKE